MGPVAVVAGRLGVSDPPSRKFGTSASRQCAWGSLRAVPEMTVPDERISMQGNAWVPSGGSGGYPVGGVGLGWILMPHACCCLNATEIQP
jgi:hypothetical protein